MKLITVVGARPQFIKAFPVMKALSLAGVENILLHTGQHFDQNMSEIFFSELGIAKPEYNLRISGGTHGWQTGHMICEIEKVLIEERPAMVVLFGDTNSTLAAAIAASKLLIPIAHIEAGLRSFNTAMPEEINRVLTDRVSSLLFSPTQLASQNLRNEGYSNSTIFEVGDVMYDAVLSVSSRLLPPNIGEKYVYVTCHRQENTKDERHLAQLLESLNCLSEVVRVVFPVHPRIRKYVEINRSALGDNVEIIEPQSYVSNLSYIKHSEMVITDSGGMQKEAFFLEKICVTLRKETEWKELVESGVNYLECMENLKAGTLAERYARVQLEIANFEMRPYGNGDASNLIASHIADYLKVS